MTFLIVALTLTAVVVLIISSIVLLVAAFKESVLWGLGSLFVPFVGLIFVIKYWADVRRAFLTNLISGVVVLLMVSALPAFATARKRAQKVRVEDLTVKIGERRNEVEKLEAKFAAQSVEVVQMHQDLVKRRASLKAGDSLATEAFNAEAAAYQAKNTAQKALQEQIAATRKVVDELLNLRAQFIAVKAKEKRVVIYTTQSCPACHAAKAYFARKGVSYEERDVEHDPAAQEDFQRMGARGVPVILVGSEQMVGFSEQRLNQLL